MKACLPARSAVVLSQLSLLVLLSVVVPHSAGQVNASDEDRLAWWRDARFGMFIHWGPVSLKGAEISWSRGREVPASEYDDLYKRFNPTEFDADEWVRTARDAGMKYIVITAKHHDGFCLWDSRFTDYDIMATPFKRDILAELSAACRKHGVKFCVYYSICDWHHPDYPTDSPGGKGVKPDSDMPRYFEYLKNQLREIIENYGPVGVLWFDGEWERPWEPKYGVELERFLRKLQPNLIINNRIGKGRDGMAGTTKQTAENPGDYDTPEQRIGAFNRDRPWETCMTICRGWSWKPNDRMKSLEECLHALARTAGGDGNFLFNVGPMPDGRIEPRQVERLHAMGAWLEKNGESVYGTRGGPFMPGPLGASTCRGNRVFVHVLDWPREMDVVKLPPISRRVVRATWLHGGEVKLSQTVEGIELGIPVAHRQGSDTIVVLELDGSAWDVSPVCWRDPSGSVAFGASAKASNVFRKMAEYAAGQAVDDDKGTRWATDTGTKQAWLEVDLGEPKRLERVYIHEAIEYGERVRRFQVEYEAGGEWKVALRGTTIGADYSAEFGPVTARRVRLNVLDSTEGPTIWEFQLFSDAAE